MASFKEQLKQKLDDLNRRYALMGVGPKMVVAEFDRDGKTVKLLWPISEFQKREIKNVIVVRTKDGSRVISVAKRWLQHASGNEFDQFVFAMPGGPTQAGPRDYNGWLGFAVEETQGDWSLNRAHWRNVICGGSESVYEWVFNWAAAMVQRPGRHAWSALVLHGGQGSGKGFFAHNTLGALFHTQQYALLLSPNDLTTDFNDHLSGRVLVFADESSWGGDIRAQQKLKGLITSDVVRINRKHISATFEPSALHVIIASNGDRPVAVEFDDRRYCVLHVVNDQQNDDAYFAPLRKELAEGGLAALLYDLQHHQINDIALRNPPDTRDKRRMKALSLSDEEVFVQNYFLNANGQFKERTPKGEWYEAYRTFMKDRRNSAQSLNQFSNTLFTLFDRGTRKLNAHVENGDHVSATSWSLRSGKTLGPDRRHAFIFPPLDTSRRIFDAATGAETYWPEDSFVDDAEEARLLDEEGAA